MHVGTIMLERLLIIYGRGWFNPRRNRPKRPPRSFAKGDDPITPYQFALRPPERSDFNDSYIGIVERKSLNALGQSLNKLLLGPQPNDSLMHDVIDSCWVLYHNVIIYYASGLVVSWALSF